jgi:hypothetical protein
MYFILFVLQDTEKLGDIFEVWEKAGISGITILPSIGLSRIKDKQALQEDFPIIPNLEDIMETQENQSRSLFTIVATQEVVDAVYQSTIGVIGPLTRPNSGIFIVLPVLSAYGLVKG